MASASLRISTLCLGIVILGLFAGPVLRAEDVGGDGVNDDASEASPSALPDIDAKAYELKTIRPSRSGRVYLFFQPGDDLPPDGKIILLREGDTPVMALRILKTYPDTRQVAAKKLLPFAGFAVLDRGSEYRAYEKIGDRTPPPPPSPEDLKDLKDLETGPTDGTPPPPPDETPAPVETPAPDETPAPEETPMPEASPTPTEEPADQDREIKKDEDDEDPEDVIETHYPNLFSMVVGLLFQSSVPGPGAKFGGGLLYSRDFSPNWAGELGIYYYQSSGVTDGSTPGVSSGLTVSSTVIPVSGAIRYQYPIGDLWTPYVYGSLVYPAVLTNVGANAPELSAMESIFPALGVGVFLQTGPNWYLRLNLGTDVVHLGVTLRF